MYYGKLDWQIAFQINTQKLFLKVYLEVLKVQKELQIKINKRVISQENSVKKSTNLSKNYIDKPISPFLQILGL